MKAIILGLLLLLSADLLAQERNIVLPYKDEHFKRFSDCLIKALQQDDSAYVFERVADDVFNGFGYNSGKEVFRRLWNDPHEPIGEELLNALKLGAAYDKEMQRIMVPWHFLAFPDSLDAFRWVYVLKDSTPVYAAPDTGAATTGRLEAGWIEVANWEPDTMDVGEYGAPRWIEVFLPSGGRGAVRRHRVRSPIDYRFWFERRNGRWLLMGWAAGD